MSQARICPNCRAPVPADAPEGVCPACALRAGFDISQGDDSPTRGAPEPSSQSLLIEDLVDRLPELEQFELIGRGGMGAVYKARQRKLDRPVAVKVLDSDLRHDPAFAERFAREARTLAQLNHPHVVSVFDFGHRDDLYYLIMEYVDGVNLRQTIEAGRLEPRQALEMVPQICEALQYAHDQGVVHRDIKPENILVDRNGSLKIADFGLAKMMGKEMGQRLTRTEQMMGTPNYMAPEQIENPGKVDHRADIFALGVVFYELLTGELPVGRFPPPSRKVQVDVRLDDVVLRTLEKEPSLRYQQASELRSDVQSLSGGGYRAAESAHAPAPPPQRPPGYEYRSARTVFGLPLVHIAFSRDPEGHRMRLASGIIAIGDIAIGGVAFGGISIGGIAFGGLSLGLVSFGGAALGLLTAIGGLGIGSFVLAGAATALFAARGGGAWTYWELSDTALTVATFLGWLIITAGVTIGVVAAAYAWLQAARAQSSQSR